MDNSCHINNDYRIEDAIGRNSEFYKRILDMKVDMTKGGGLHCIQNGAPAPINYTELRKYANNRDQSSLKRMPQEKLFMSYFCSENNELYT